MYSGKCEKFLSVTLPSYMMKKIDSCRVTFAQGWISCNIIFGNLYEGAVTCTTVLVVKLQTVKFRIDLTIAIFASVSFN